MKLTKKSKKEKKDVFSESEDSDNKTRTMSLSIKEGYFGGLSQTLSDQFMTPYALALQMSPSLMGITRSLLGIIPSIGQVIGSSQMKNNSRRNLVIKGVFLQILMWPLIMLLGIFASNNWHLSLLPILLTIFYLLYSFFGSTALPGWFSLMGDIVPENFRGRYFSKRNLLITASSISLTILASVALETFKIRESVFLGFFLIFLIAFLSRIISAIYLSRHYYPPFQIEKQSYLSIGKFLKAIPRSNFGIFTLLMMFIQFSVNIGVPFMGYYMLDELHFNYIEYICVNLSTPLLSLLFYPLLGRISDKYGNVFVLRVCGFLLPILPILWTFLSTPLQLIFGPQLISAFAWTGVNLAASNFIYDNIETQQRGFYVAYYNFFTGLGLLGGGILGSFLLPIVPIIFVSVYETLFLISGLSRLVFDLIFLFRIKEVRVKKTK